MKKYKLRIISIFSLFLALHLYKLTDIPSAIHVDEAGLWYNVQCLLNYGVDQSNNSWPILFTNFYGEQSAMYTYLAFICCKIFGDSLFAIRLPAVLGACLIFIFGYKIVNELYNRDKINLLFCVLCTICPYFLIEFRYALDCNLMLSFSTVFLWFLIKAIDTKKILDTIIAGVTCGLVLWSYGLSYMAMPIYLVIVLVYLIYFKKINWKQVISFVVPLSILALPLIIVQIINIFNLPEFIIGNITLTKFEFPRHTDLSFDNFLKNIFTYTVYFVIGSPIATENIFYSNFYLFSIPFICIGFFSLLINTINSIKNKNYSVQMFLFLWFVANFITALFITVNPTYYQINACMFIGLIFLIEGLLQSIKYINSIIKKYRVTQLLLICMILVFLISFMILTYSYFGDFYNSYINNNYLYAESLKDVLNHIEDNKLCAFFVNPIYYKIVTAEHPLNHPFKYSLSESNIILEHYYPYENFMFCNKDILFESINPNATYVIPKRKLVEMTQLDMLNFSQIEVGNYIIFKPN